MAGREPIRRVRIGPYLACKFRRVGSRSAKDVPSQRRLPMRGKAAGPGGSLSFGKKKSWRDLRREAMQRETTKRKTHISIFWRSKSIEKVSGPGCNIKSGKYCVLAKILIFLLPFSFYFYWSAFILFHISYHSL